MIKFLYDSLVRKNANVQYEYERYVIEHLEEHYKNRYKQWKILLRLNWHYRIKKSMKPLIYKERNAAISEAMPAINQVDSILMDTILPGIELCEKILFGHKKDTKIFLCPYVGTGDVYLAGMYMNAYARANNIENFVVVVIGGANYKVASLFNLQEIIKVTQAEADILMRVSMFLARDNDTIIVMHHHAPQVYCGILENMRNINGLNFTDLFLNNVFHLDLYKDREQPKFDYKSNDIDDLFRQKDLEEGNTVILSPYVNTLPPLPWWVWVKLAECLKQQGYVVCTNCGKEDEHAVDGTIPLHFGINIAVPFLEKCGYFIGIRSGFCDIVSSAKCKKIIIYQPYIFWGAGTVCDYFSLNRIGFCNDAIELEYKGVEFLQLINQILAGMKDNISVSCKNELRNNTIDYIIVQAGGKGTRMGYLTKNRPKALVPVNNLPILFHLFKKFPNKKFIIIGDYKCDVLEKYLEAFAKVEYVVVDAKGKTGTCGGLRQALQKLPEDSPFMLIWSDLILPKDFSFSELEIGKNYIGISESFPCRWKYEAGSFKEEKSEKYGVAGMFVLQNKELLAEIPESGELVRWLSEREKSIEFYPVSLAGANEYGILTEYNKLEKKRCRPFNQLIPVDHVLIKEGITEQGKQLGNREILWYKKVIDKRFPNLPKIYAFDPLIMENIQGKNIYEYTDLSVEKKKYILEQIVSCLKQLHEIGKCRVDVESYEEAYIGKTLNRLEKVKQLVPFAKEAHIIVNGRKCRNFFYHIEEIRCLLKQYMPKDFVFLHGDCTFSNIMIRNNGTPVMIDPRGYFGKTEFYGDIAYDWAKLYYSIVGNYDQFNLKRFRLDIENNEVFLDIDSSGWEDIEDYFFSLLGDDISKTQIKLIHAIIWLSLTTYAWEDYDSICGAFYNGIFYLEEIL